MKRSADILFIVFFVLFIAAVPALLFLRGFDKGISFYENRSLSGLPAANPESVLSGDYFSSCETWLGDHIAGRERLLKINTWIDYRLLDKPVVNDIIVDEDLLLPYQPYVDKDTGYIKARAIAACDGLSKIQELVSSYGANFYYLGIPFQSSYYYERYPSYMDNRGWYIDAATSEFSEALRARGISFMNMAEIFKKLGNPEAYYSKTDHHFTYYGAFAVYQAVLSRINEDLKRNLPVLTEADMVFKTLPNPFLGSNDRKLYGLWEGEESLVIGEQLHPVSFTRTDNGAVSPPELYRLPANDTDEISYDVYMGGDQAETVIDTGRPELPDLLIFGDSFTNPLETLMYTGFNVTRCVDLRHYTDIGILEYIEQYKPDVVICVRDDTAYLSTEGNGNIS